MIVSLHGLPKACQPSFTRCRLAILLGESPRFTRTALPLALALYFFEAALLAIFFVESLAILVADAPGLADGVAFSDALPLALISPARRLRIGQTLPPWPAVVVAASAGVALPSPIALGRASEAPSQTARLMTVAVNVGIDPSPEYASAKPGWGRHGPALTRCERYTAVSASPGTLSSPDVREIRWFLHLRYARDVPDKAPVQRSSANGRAISADTSNAS